MILLDSFDYVDPAQEYGDFDILNALTGWISEPIPIHPILSQQVESALMNLSLRCFGFNSQPSSVASISSINKNVFTPKERTGSVIPMKENIVLLAVGDGEEPREHIPSSLYTLPHRILEMRETDSGEFLVRMRASNSLDAICLSENAAHDGRNDFWMSYKDFTGCFRYRT